MTEVKADRQLQVGIRTKCLELAVLRNQKLSASASDVVSEASVYEKYVRDGGLTEKKPGAK